MWSFDQYPLCHISANEEAATDLPSEFNNSCNFGMDMGVPGSNEAGSRRQTTRDKALPLSE